MTNGNLIPRNFWSLPAFSFPSFIDEEEDLMSSAVLPSANFLQGLSISEDDKNLYVEAAVPGIDPKEVEVTFSKGILTIKAEKKEEEKGKTYQRRATRSFFYRISPGDVDLNAEPQATCKNGVMKITFAKAQESRPKKISVKVT